MSGNNVIYVEVDPASFKKEVQDILLNTELWNHIVKQGGLKVDWKSPAGVIANLGELVHYTIASVEVIKQNMIKDQDPTGAKGLKFDAHVALDSASEILVESVHFRGFVGSFVEMFKKPLVHMLIESALAAYKGRNWLMVARTILSLV